MLKETITYTDYNDVTRTEDYYFNLTKSELATMELGRAGGLQTRLNRIVNASDTPEIMEEFRYILRKAYGIKSDDGRRFMKSDEIFEAFEQSEAYNELFMRLIGNPDYATNFINGILPKDIQKEINENRNNVSSIPAPKN